MDTPLIGAGGCGHTARLWPGSYTAQSTHTQKHLRTTSPAGTDVCLSVTQLHLWPPIPHLLMFQPAPGRAPAGAPFLLSQDPYRAQLALANKQCDRISTPQSLGSQRQAAPGSGLSPAVSCALYYIDRVSYVLSPRTYTPNRACTCH